jgi:hypothetical protein
MASERIRRTRVSATTTPSGAATLDTWGTIVTPEELQSLLGLDAEEATRVSQLVQITIEAYCWPNVIADPIPPPVHAVGLALAARFAGAELSKAGAVVGETVGAYSYRLASPLTFDSVVLVLGELAEELGPWAPMHDSAYTLDTSPGEALAWPVDYWQRDLDRIYGATS